MDDKIFHKTCFKASIQKVKIKMIEDKCLKKRHNWQEKQEKPEIKKEE